MRNFRSVVVPGISLAACGGADKRETCRRRSRLPIRRSPRGHRPPKLKAEQALFGVREYSDTKKAKVSDLVLRYWSEAPLQGKTRMLLNKTAPGNRG